MGAAREKDQADFDLDRFIDMFDIAVTSKDERVVGALRNLMMMVILTAPETNRSSSIDKEQGPLRRVVEDIGHLSRRINRLEEENHKNQRGAWAEIERSPISYPEKLELMKALHAVPTPLTMSTEDAKKLGILK